MRSEAEPGPRRRPVRVLGAVAAIAAAVALLGACAPTGTEPVPQPSGPLPAAGSAVTTTSGSGATSGTVSGAATAVTPAHPSARRPCGVDAVAPTYRHVVWVVMENRDEGEVVGSSSTPYLDALARACGLADDSGVAHPSLPNYLALTSGSTHGVADDGGPDAHPIAGASIFSLLGRRWRALEQAMPAACDPTSAGEYAPKHNPAVYYTALAGSCPSLDVALGAQPDLSAAFTFVTPDLCADMHDCTTATGDAWLAHEMPEILDSAQYRAGHTAVFVTWDEADGGGNRIATYVVAPSVRPGTHPATSYTHYGLLATTEDLLGLRPLLGAADGATTLTGSFHL